MGSMGRKAMLGVYVAVVLCSLLLCGCSRSTWQCDKCGAENQNGITICARCGDSYGVEDMVIESMNETAMAANMIMLIVGIICLIVGIVCFARVFLAHRPGKPVEWAAIIGLLVWGTMLITMSLGEFSKIFGAKSPDVEQIMNGTVEGGDGPNATGWDRG